MGLLSVLGCRGRGLLTRAGCSVLVAGVLGPGVGVILLALTGTAETGDGLSEGGGGHEGGQKHRGGCGICHQLHHADASGAQAGAGAQGQEEDCRSRVEVLLAADASEEPKSK